MRAVAAAWTVLVIALVVSTHYLAAAFITMILRLPWDMSLPPAVRVLGLAPIVAGSGMLAWLFRYRRFVDILVSTYETFVKLFGRMPLQERRIRTEPLVVSGPYRVVRHPMYSGIGMIALGIGVLTDHTWALLGALILCVWFAYGIGPFEERELKALFGGAYEDYARMTPRIVPIPWRRLWSR